jgi:uncharacterized membrane protein
METHALITNDAVVLGILLGLLALVFTTHSSKSPFWRRFYSVVPSVLVCYFMPSVLGTLGIIDGEASQLYFVASRYLLPTSLVLLTISVDMRGILRLGPKALIMFLTGTVGIVIGGPLAILLVGSVAPEIVGGQGADAVWRGLTTVAGSWIGGGANQAAMKEVFGVGDDLFSAMIAVDVIVANIWMAVLLFLVGRADRIDARTGADTSAIDDLRRRVEAHERAHARIPTLTDIMQILAVGFGVTAVAHFLADLLAPAIEAAAPGLAVYNLTSKFFWLVVLATTFALALSATRVRRLEDVGASKVGSACLYVLVATIGMQMNLAAILERPGLFLIGAVWMLIHAALMLGVAKAIKAPVFFMAVGSQANVGGAASAPIVASAVHPSLAPVGALLAVLGYAVGTYGAYICGQIMRVAAGG